MTKTYPSVTERYYTPRYKLDVHDKQNEDLCVLFHSNKICIVGLAQSHPVICERKSIKSIDFQVTKKVNRLNNKVSGKNKKGAQWLDSNSQLCTVECLDGSTYAVYCCVRGKLVEVNEQLQKNPQLLVEKPQAEGYIAIVLPKFEETESVKEDLLTQIQYEEALTARSVHSTHSAASESTPKASADV